MSPTRRVSKKAAKAAAAAAKPARPFTAHLLVPPHELLSESESLETLQRLGTSIERLPKVLMTDPGLKTDPKFVSAREAHEPLQGRLIRIRRPSATAGEAIAYRVLVQSVGE
ncbi:MAG TPA: DNA-directed RNA polymerase subunit RpoH/Rpb5 C-terminal domain-containing protein [Thermoplasmata archaeon]|nr:DNA-directed RNA polymerase subunit RpoH/Rpb5 C-terminal domain-containing protein [Thermoplasmata archaeon]